VSGGDVVERWHRQAPGQVGGGAEDHHDTRLRRLQRHRPASRHVGTDLGGGAVAVSFALAALSMCTLANARPRPGGYPDPQYQSFVQELLVPDRPPSLPQWNCCSIADCRQVLARTVPSASAEDVSHGGLYWEALVMHSDFDMPNEDSRAPDDWVKIPWRKVIPDSRLPAACQSDHPKSSQSCRPIGATLCWVDGNVRCFVPPLTGG
jgi:hypothetical protein